MPLSLTPFTGAAYLQTGQSHAELTVNEFIAITDSVIFGRVKDFDPSPPVSPVNGNRFIVSTSATGIWTGHDNDIAIYFNGWRFIEPVLGMRFYVEDLNGIFMFNGTAWVSGGVVADLTGGIGASYNQGEVTGIYNKVNAILSALRATGVIRT